MVPTSNEVIFLSVGLTVNHVRVRVLSSQMIIDANNHNHTNLRWVSKHTSHRANTQTRLSLTLTKRWLGQGNREHGGKSDILRLHTYKLLESATYTWHCKEGQSNENIAQNTFGCKRVIRIILKRISKRCHFYRQQK